MSKILLVEQNGPAQTTLQSGLTAQGHHILIAGNGFNAVTTAQIEEPDLIIMSMELPGLTGWQAAEQLKASAYTRQIPIVALTTENNIEDARRCILIGCDAHLPKPVDMDRLRRQVAALLLLTVHS